MSERMHFSPNLGRYSTCSNPDNCRFKTSTHYSKEVVALMDDKGGIVRDKISSSFDILNYSKTFDKTMITTKKIAPEGFSSVYCDNCERYQSIKHYQRVSASRSPVQCEYCSNKLDANILLVDIRDEDKKFLNDTEVKNAHWYHTTNQKDWLRRLQDTGEYDNSKTVLAHVGTKEAAKERLRDILNYVSNAEDTEYYLYELKLKNNAEINPVVFQDVQDEWPETVGSMGRTPFNKKGVNRYVNEYEAAGSISLLADPNLFELVKVSKVKLK